MPLTWKPLLAATLPVDGDLDALPYPLYGSPKIDGFRCVVQGGKALSRKGLALRNPAVQELLGCSAYDGLDGELVLGKPYGADVFNRTTDKGRGVNNGSEEAAAWFRAYGVLWVIDRYEERGASFAVRHKLLAAESRNWLAYLRFIPQVKLKNADALREYETQCLDSGYEGVMLRRGDSGAYMQKSGKENRSTLKEFELVKFKRREFGTAKIVAVYHLEHNANEEKTAAGKRSSKKSGLVVDNTKWGSVELYDAKRKWKFTVSIQTNEMRAWKGWDEPTLWSGRSVRYSYQLVGSKDAPRQPQATLAELR